MGGVLAMTDWTARVIELEEAKAAMIAAKKAVKSEADRKARAAARREIAERIGDLEYQFAKRLAMANAEGMPQALIRKEVLRTGDWETWTKWRDLAEIEPERVTMENARKVAANEKASFVWDFEAGTLLVKKRKDGVPLETPLVLNVASIRYGRDMWVIDGVDAANEALIDSYMRSIPLFLRYLSNEIERAISAGEVAKPA